MYQIQHAQEDEVDEVCNAALTEKQATHGTQKTQRSTKSANVDMMQEQKVRFCNIVAGL